MALTAYEKPHLTIPEQVELLASRGMGIDDPQLGGECLERFGYYRLSGYWYPMRESVLRAGPDGQSVQVLDSFRQGTELRHCVDLCVFDKRLRLLMSDAIERIEVALRVDVAYLLSARDRWAHLTPDELHGNFTKANPITGLSRHDDWMQRLATLEARSKEDYVKHFRAKYASPLPIWVSIELWDFGMLSVLLEGLKYADKAAIAAKYGVPRPDLLTSWTRALNHVRNICAHHSRLWNRSPSDQPKPPRTGEVPLLDHLANDTFAQTRFYAVAAVTQLLLTTINPRSTWAQRLKAHAATFPAAPGISFGQSGFPDDWQQLPLWA